MKPAFTHSAPTGLLVLLLLLGSPGVGAVSAQEASEEQAIHQMWATFEELFHQGNSQGIGRIYTEDADRRNGLAEHARGGAEVQQMYEAIFAGRPSRQNSEATRVRFEYEVRLLRPDVALIDGFYLQPTGTRGMFTVVTTKEDGAWRMAAGRAGALLN